MHRFRQLSPQVGSSALETLMVGALAVLVAAAVVGVALLTVGPRSKARNAGPAAAAGSSAPAVPVLEVGCGADTASLEGGAIDAWADGVSVRVAGDVGAVVTFASPGTSGYRMQLFEASGAYRLPLAPGPWTVGCAASGVAVRSTMLGAFDVRDPQHLYLSPEPVCPASGCCEEVVDLPAGFTEDEVGTLHGALAEMGVRQTDTIERAAYVGSSFSLQPPNPLVYRVVRDLQTVARLDVAGEGEAWSARVSGCPAG